MMKVFVVGLALLVIAPVSSDAFAQNKKTGKTSPQGQKTKATGIKSADLTVDKAVSIIQQLLPKMLEHGQRSLKITELSRNDIRIGTVNSDNEEIAYEHYFFSEVKKIELAQVSEKMPADQQMFGVIRFYFNGKGKSNFGNQNVSDRAFSGKEMRLIDGKLPRNDRKRLFEAFVYLIKIFNPNLEVNVINFP